jgi:hypothetical protein
MAVINGAKSLDEVIKTVKAGFFSVIRVCILSVTESHSILAADHLGSLAVVYNCRAEVHSCGCKSKNLLLTC